MPDETAATAAARLRAADEILSDLDPSSEDPVDARRTGDALLDKASALAQLGRICDAVPVWDTIVQRSLEPSSPDESWRAFSALTSKAYYLRADGRMAEALTACDQLLALPRQPDYDWEHGVIFDATLLRRSVLCKLGDLEETYAIDAMLLAELDGRLDSAGLKRAGSLLIDRVYWMLRTGHPLRAVDAYESTSDWALGLRDTDAFAELADQLLSAARIIMDKPWYGKPAHENALRLTAGLLGAVLDATPARLRPQTLRGSWKRWVSHLRSDRGAGRMLEFWQLLNARRRASRKALQVLQALADDLQTSADQDQRMLAARARLLAGAALIQCGHPLAGWQLRQAVITASGPGRVVFNELIQEAERAGSSYRVTALHAEALIAADEFGNDEDVRAAAGRLANDPVPKRSWPSRYLRYYALDLLKGRDKELDKS